MSFAHEDEIGPQDEGENYFLQQEEQAYKLFDRALGKLLDLRFQNVVTTDELSSFLTDIGEKALSTLWNIRDGRIMRDPTFDMDEDGPFSTLNFNPNLAFDDEDETEDTLSEPIVELWINLTRLNLKNGVSDDEIAEEMAADLVLDVYMAHAYTSGELAENGFIATVRKAIIAQHRYIQETTSHPLVKELIPERSQLSEEEIQEKIAWYLPEHMLLVDTTFSAFKEAARREYAEQSKIKPEDQDEMVHRTTLQQLESIFSDDPEEHQKSLKLFLMLLCSPNATDTVADYMIHQETHVIQREKRRPLRRIRYKEFTRLQTGAWERLESLPIEERQSIAAEGFIGVLLERYLNVPEDEETDEE